MTLRAMTVVVVLCLGAAACGGGSSDTPEDEYRGAIVIDDSGAHLCGALAESYPPQCGDPIVRLADLKPESVVALQSPTDPTLAPVSWTDWAVGVTGEVDDGVMTFVELTDPVVSNASGGLAIRVADLGISAGEPLVFPIDLRNATDAGIGLTFTSGQRAEVTLTNSSGEEVYRWSEGKGFTAEVTELELPAGSLVGATLSDEPVSLPPGTYSAKAWITADEAINVVVEWQIEIAG